MVVASLALCVCVCLCVFLSVCVCYRSVCCVYLSVVTLSGHSLLALCAGAKCPSDVASTTLFFSCVLDCVSGWISLWSLCVCVCVCVCGVVWLCNLCVFLCIMDDIYLFNGFVSKMHSLYRLQP